MISETLATELNKQIEMEGYASSLYLSMSCWCEHKGLKGCCISRRQSEEENMHMLKIIDYILDVDAIPVIPSISKPPAQFDSIVTLMRTVLSMKKGYSLHTSISRTFFKEENSDTFNSSNGMLLNKGRKRRFMIFWIK